MGAFSGFNEKRKKTDVTPSVGAHYTKLARKSATIRYTCLVLIVLFAVYSLSFHSSEITIENFRYMLKFINLGDDADSPLGTSLAFDGSDGNRGLIYKGDLAVLNESGLTITGWDGEVILKETLSLDHPKINQNETNLFCYDLGGKELKIFNSYSLLNTLSFDYPINGFASSKSGNFAVISSAKGYRSAIYIYDKQFIPIYTSYFGDKYADFVDISVDGKEFLTASHYSEGGNLITRISKFRVDQEGALFEEKFIGEIPLGIYYNENGYCLMTDCFVRCFDNDNNLVSTATLSGKKLLSAKVFKNRTLVTFSLEGLSGGTKIIIYRNDGSIEFSKDFNHSISDITIIGDTLYALSPGKLSVCDILSGSDESFEVLTSFSALIEDGEKVILFSENSAEYFDKENFVLKEEQ